MSIKKELLSELNIQQLKDFATSKSIKFKLSDIQKNYYANWEEKDVLVDIMVEKEVLTVKEIERYIKSLNK